MSEQAPTSHPRRTHPVVARMAGVVDALGPELCARVVFIGASLLPLLETEADVLSSPRPTRDVDVVTATRTYTQMAMLDERLRERGFRNAVDATRTDRWHAPDGTLLGIVSCGIHSVGTASANDEWVIGNAIETIVSPSIRHSSAVGVTLPHMCGLSRPRGDGAGCRTPGPEAHCVSGPGTLGAI